MGLEELKGELGKLEAVHSCVQVEYEFRGIKFHLRDLSAAEEAEANEYSYASVEASGLSKKALSSSMRAAYTYRMAVVALAIRNVQFGDTVWDVNVEDPMRNEVDTLEGERAVKFPYMLEMIKKWGTDLVQVLYQAIIDERDKSNIEDMRSRINAENFEAPPAREQIDSKFKQVDEPPPPESEHDKDSSFHIPEIPPKPNA